MNISYLDFSLKPAVFCCLTNAMAPPPIAPESCSNPQKVRQVFRSHMAWLCALITLTPKAVESCSKAQKMQQVF